MTDITTTRNDEKSRYEIRSGETLAGFIEFTRGDGRTRFTHTSVDPAFQGQGIAGQLADFAVTDAASAGDILVPLCPFVEKHLRRNEIAGATIEWPQRPPEPGSAGSSRGR